MNQKFYKKKIIKKISNESYLKKITPNLDKSAEEGTSKSSSPNRELSLH
jgi:hypothetical protein